MDIPAITIRRMIKQAIPTKNNDFSYFNPSDGGSVVELEGIAALSTESNNGTVLVKSSCY
jgi:hypothetical protein